MVTMVNIVRICSLESKQHLCRVELSREGFNTQQSCEKLLPLKRLLTEVLNRSEQVFTPPSLPLIAFLFPHILLCKSQTEWPLFGCFLAYRVNNICRLFMCASCFLLGVLYYGNTGHHTKIHDSTFFIYQFMSQMLYQYELFTHAVTHPQSFDVSTTHRAQHSLKAFTYTLHKWGFQFYWKLKTLKF